jgi:twitching motility protein PilT
MTERLAGEGSAALDVDALLREAVRRGASDVHIAAEAPPVLRINGALERLPWPAVPPAQAEALVRRLANPEQLGRLERDGGVDFAYGVPGLGRFRVVAYRQRGSVSLAIRPIPWRVPSLEELGAPAAVADLARRPSGLVVVAGRPGSGTSTTAAAMVDLINRERAAHVVTLEEPVEYLHRHQRGIVDQREIGLDSPSFAHGLRTAARSDPDAVLVGDLRDAETAHLSLTLAGNGRLVLAVVRQPDVAHALDYLVTLFPPEAQAQVAWQLAAVLEGGTAQALLPRADGRGRVAAFEVLVATPAVRSLVREGRRHQIPALLRAGARHGMRSLEAAARELVAEGIVRPEDVPPPPGAAREG